MSPRDALRISTLLRALRRPGLLALALVIATLGLAGALAWHAMRAAASHRAAVEAALEHHAATAAWRFAREARGWVSYGMNEAADALQREVDRSARLPGPDVLQRLLAQKYCDCMTAAFGRTFVRVVPGSEASPEIIGEPLSQRARDELRDRMLALAADTLPLHAERRWQILAPGAPRLNRGSDVALLWRIGGRAGRPRVVYAMIVERAQLERPLIGARDGAQFFPPALVPASAAASLVHVEVAGPNGVPLFTAGPQTHRFRGTDTIGADYGNLVALAAIDPAAARVFVAGGLPPSRVPLILALLTLALIMGGAAATLLRREQRLARLREDFVSGVSHELRTPLTHIRALSELLERDGFRTSTERSRAIGIIHRESLRLTNLVDDILQFTRLRRTSAAAAPALSPVPLRHVVHDTVESLRPLIEAGGSRLELLAPDDVVILGEREAIGRVLRNLIDNAAKYGASTQTIRVTLSRTSNGARITVDDEGPGIPAADSVRIWQPYHRLDRDRNAPGGGTGLGLAVVADIVRLLGGTASVEDAPGRGARFIVDLPAVP